MVTTIGFFGTGDMSDTIIEQLLEDQLIAAKEGVEFILPWSSRYVTEALAVVFRFAKQKLIPVTVVTEPTIDNNYHTKPDGVRKIISSSYAPLGVVQQLETAANPKLLVLWDNETSKEENVEERRVVQRALDNSVEVRNLCDAITEIQSLEDNLTTEEITIYSHDELDKLTYDEEGNEQLTAIAIQLGYTKDQVEEAPSWNAVVEYIESAQNEVIANAVDETPGATDDETVATYSEPVEAEAEEDVALTYEQLKAAFASDPKLPTSEAKKTAALYGITEAAVKEWTNMERPRTDRYIAYLDAVQDQLRDGAGEDEASEEAAPIPVGAQERETASAQADEAQVITGFPAVYGTPEVSYATISTPEPIDLTELITAIAGGLSTLVLSNQDIASAIRERTVQEAAAQKEMIAAIKEQDKPAVVPSANLSGTAVQAKPVGNAANAGPVTQVVAHVAPRQVKPAPPAPSRPMPPRPPIPRPRG